MPDNFTDQFIGYVKKQMARFRAGDDEYHGSSFNRSVTDMFDEIEEEIIDQSNWAFLAYHALQKTRAKYDEVQKRIHDGEIYVESLNKQIADLEDRLDVSQPSPPPRC